MADTGDRLVELLNKVQDTGGIDIPAGFGSTYKWVRNQDVASHLIANGVIAPPVKVGQKVYTIPRSAIREWTVCGVWISADEKCSYAHVYWEDNGHHMASRAVNFSDLGKTVFLSRAEAERALAERSK